jgi:hypothetical protein
MEVIMNPFLVNRLRAIRSSLLATYAGGEGLPNAVIGVEREAFIREFISKVFPPHYRFVGGSIIDSLSQEISGQVDIAVLLPSAPSFPMPSAGDQRLVLAENVGVVIEVKSNISTQWGQVLETIKKIKPLKKFMRKGENEGELIVADIPVIAVGYKGWKDVWALKEHWERENKDVRPDAVLIIEQQAFVSAFLQAEQDGALIAFIAYLSRILKDHEQIPTDLLRYVGRIASMS